MSDENNQDDDLDIFQKEMEQVIPIKPSNKIGHRIKRKTPVTKMRTQSETPDYDIDDNFSDAAVEDCPEQLSYSKSGLQHSALKKLRLGKNPIENHLDLHGMTVEEARQALLHFIAECEDSGIRNALVVHGKGYSSPNNKPVIKAYVNHWLKLSPMVLAFCSAQPSDGGTGAVYVLLKNSR